MSAPKHSTAKHLCVVCTHSLHKGVGGGGAHRLGKEGIKGNTALILCRQWEVLLICMYPVPVYLVCYAEHKGSEHSALQLGQLHKVRCGCCKHEGVVKRSKALRLVTFNASSAAILLLHAQLLQN